VRRAWLGVELQPLLKSGGATEGALVSGVIADSPAARAGLAAGDVLVKLAGEKVNARYAEEVPVLTQMICGMSVGAEIEAVVLRGGQRKIVKLTTAERPLMEPKTRELRTWGVTARNISFIAAREMRLTDTNGVLVTSVRNGGPSGEAKPPLMPGDVVREVAGHRVNNVAELVAVSEEITAGKNTPTPAIVSLDRRRDNVVTVVNIGVKELDEPGMEARKAALSASVQAISRELAAQSGQKEITGVRVTQVYPDSAAAAAGLRVGDWIVSLDGEKIPVSQPGDEETFVQMIRQYRIGTKAVFGVLRGQNRCTLTIELTAAPKPEREMRRYHDPNFEFTARDLTYHDRLARQLAETKPGVIVIEVVGGSWAAVAQLRGGDIIVGVNGEPVKDVASLEKKLKQLVRQRSKEVVLHVQHGIHSRYLELQPDWNHNGSSATKGKS
jgi:serine protease Do